MCLATGNYGTWAGTNKAITVAAAAGASPQMRINFGSGDSGFTLDGMTGMGGDINGASNITIRNSTFTGSIDIGGANTNVVLDGNTHNWNAVYSGGLNAKICLWATRQRAPWHPRRSRSRTARSRTATWTASISVTAPAT